MHSAHVASLSGALEVWSQEQIPLQRNPKRLFGVVRSLAVQRELREASVLGALTFAAMNASWTTLIFFIAGPPYTTEQPQPEC